MLLSTKTIVSQYPKANLALCVARTTTEFQATKRKAQAFQAWASQIFGFVAIDRSVAALAVCVLGNHLVLRRTINHAASNHVVLMRPAQQLDRLQLQATPSHEYV